MSITTALKARVDAVRNREDREAGFTLIELLVVVIIIGILAAIAIPVYIGVQNNAKDSAVKSDLANEKTAVISYYTNNNSLPTQANLTVSTLGSLGFTQGSDTSNVTITSGTTPGTFCLSAKSTATTNTWYVTTSGGVQSGPCPTTF